MDAESQHFINVCYAFLSYFSDANNNVENMYKCFKSLSKDDLSFLIEPPSDRISKILSCIQMNYDFILLLLQAQTNVDLNTYSDCDIMCKLRCLCRSSGFCQIPDTIPDSLIAPSTESKERHINSVRSTLRQFMRDWSIVGKRERDCCYGPLLHSLVEHIKIDPKQDIPKVLCPGSGLGRLPYEIVQLGYSCQGNEFSYFMLMGSNFILNHAIEPESQTIYPFCLNTSNRKNHDDHLQPVLIPDVCPSIDSTLLDNPNGPKLSMTVGEFVEVYSDSKEVWDGVLTCFFLDTAKNIIDYIRTIAKLVKIGGLWANIGPLLYHYVDSPGTISIELSWEEIRKIIETWFTIVKFEWKETYYTTNYNSIMQVKYNSIFFEGIRNDNVVHGVSNPVWDVILTE